MDGVAPGEVVRGPASSAKVRPPAPLTSHGTSGVSPGFTGVEQAVRLPDEGGMAG